LSVFDAARPVLSASEIAATLGMNRKTVHRFLLSLENVGAVTRVGRGQYTLGMALADLGSRVAVHSVLADTAMPHMLPFAESLNESLQVGVMERDEIVSIAHVPSRHTLSIGIRVGMRWPAYCTAIGKNLLADLGEAGLKEYLGKVKLERRTPGTIVDHRKLARHLGEVREQGFAVNDQESELGMRGVSVPILNRQSRYIAALSVSGPTTRLPMEALMRIKNDLADCAEEISQTLYGRDALP
jgi:DNA-binding IclR family transcriptional regulator